MFWHIFIKNLVAVWPCWPLPPSSRLYCYYRPSEGGRSPAGLWLQVRCCPSQHSSQFSVPGLVECEGAGSQFHYLALSKWTVALHPSGQIPETVVLYDTPSKYCGGMPRPGFCEVKNWVDLSNWQSSPPRGLIRVKLVAIRRAFFYLISS
jgi:hypothetical protein